MAKFCTHCGNEVNENAVICVKCGCAINNYQSFTGSQTIPNAPFKVDKGIVNTISQRFQINGVIWIVIAVLQILAGLSFDWFILIVGVLNLVSAINDLNFSKIFPQNPIGVVDRVRSLTGPIITLIYNLVFGGIIGVVGSIYYFVAIRGYVMENERGFLEIENDIKSNNIQF